MFSANWTFSSAYNSYIAVYWLNSEENQVKKKVKEIINKKETAFTFFFVFTIFLLI